MTAKVMHQFTQFIVPAVGAVYKKDMLSVAKQSIPAKNCPLYLIHTIPFIDGHRCILMLTLM